MTGVGKDAKRAIAAILSMAALMLWLGYHRPAGLRVPSFVAYICAFTLAMSACALYAKATGRAAGNSGFGALTLLGFVATGAWIALAPEARQGCRGGFMVSSGNAALGQMTDTSPSACQIAFGLGAVMSLLAAVWALALWWRLRRPGSS